jgi:cytochrome P450
MLLAANVDESGEKMPQIQLLHEVMTIFMAGHETSANSLNWAFYLLGKNPSIHERLKAEIKTVLGERVPTFEDLKQLPYTQQVVQEVLRLYPPAWGIGRKTLQKDRWGEYDIPANTDVAIVIYLLHRDEKYWENPDAFRPERFSPENFSSEQKKAYMPFGGGQRMCIGHHFAMMEMQLIIAMVVQRFHLQLENPQEEMQIEPKITLHSKSPIYMKISD